MFALPGNPASSVGGSRSAGLERPRPFLPTLAWWPSTCAGWIWQQLLAGEADLAVVRAAPNQPGLSHAVVGYDRMRVAVDHSHRLAARAAVNLAELAGETFVVWAPAGRSAHTDFLVGVCQAAGFHPRTVVTPRQGMPPITAVHDSGWVAFVTDDPGPAEPDAVVLELHPPVHMPLQVVWVTDAVSPHARPLLEQMRAAAAGGQRVV